MTQFDTETEGREMTSEGSGDGAPQRAPSGVSSAGTAEMLKQIKARCAAAQDRLIYYADVSGIVQRDVPYLLGEVARLERELTSERTVNTAYQTEIAKLERAEAEVARLKSTVTVGGLVHCTACGTALAALSLCEGGNPPDEGVPLAGARVGPSAPKGASSPSRGDAITEADDEPLSHLVRGEIFKGATAVCGVRVGVDEGAGLATFYDHMATCPRCLGCPATPSVAGAEVPTTQTKGEA